MKNSHLFFHRLRRLMAITATLVFFLSALLPAILGLLTRQMITGHINGLSEVTQDDVNVISLSASTVRAGWFSSEIQITASGPLFSLAGQPGSSRTGVLHINHGPIIWHLSDSLLALADMQLLPLAGDTNTSDHFSGAAIVRLDSSLDVTLDGIVGINTAEGDHWLQMQILMPIVPFRRSAGDLWFDLDKQALNAAGLQPYVTQWLQNLHARLSNDRLLFYIGLH